MSEFEHIKQEGTSGIQRNELLIEEQYNQDLQVSKFTDFKNIDADQVLKVKSRFKRQLPIREIIRGLKGNYRVFVKGVIFIIIKRKKMKLMLSLYRKML